MDGLMNVKRDGSGPDPLSLQFFGGGWGGTHLITVYF